MRLSDVHSEFARDRGLSLVVAASRADPAERARSQSDVEQ